MNAAHEKRNRAFAYISEQISRQVQGGISSKPALLERTNECFHLIIIKYLFTGITTNIIICRMSVVSNNSNVM